MKNILELSREFPNLKVEISAEDLLATMRSIASEIIEYYEKTEEPEQYLTPKMTTQELNVSLSTLWRWHKEKYLEHIAIGGKRRYKRSDINKILRKEVV